MVQPDNAVNDSNNFETSDLGLAASLSASGYKVNYVDKDDPKRVIFVFDVDSSIEKAVTDYWSGGLLLPASTLFEHTRLLKSRIYS